MPQESHNHSPGEHQRIGVTSEVSEPNPASVPSWQSDLIESVISSQALSGITLSHDVVSLLLRLVLSESLIDLGFEAV